jgi:tetratricopeptide (TPR) repeat protein
MIKKVLIFIFLSLSLFAKGEGFEEIKSQYFKSYDYEKVGRYSEAIKVLTPLYKKYPKGYALNLRFGWLFFLDKKYNDAIKYYKKASLRNTFAIDPKLGLIRVYLATYSYQKAETVSYEILKTDYYNYYANLYAIKALIAQKKYQLALSMLKKMLALYPTDVLFLEQLAMVYKATKNPYLKQTYQDILILDPNNIFVRSNFK